MTASGLASVSATDLARRLQRRDIRAIDVVEDCLARIAARESTIHAWAFLDPDRARGQAHVLDAGPIRGPLHGIPVGVKDLIDTADMPTAYGSPIYAGHRPAWDAACVAAARSSGAVVIGKTVTTEFATFTAGRHPQPTRLRAHARRLVERFGGGGGRRDGPARVRLADGGLDHPAGERSAASSATSRASARCSRAGVKLLAESLDTFGALSRTVDDAALLVGALSGRAELVMLAAASRLRIGLCRTHDWNQTQPEVAEAMDAAARKLSAAGARVSQIELPQDFASLGDAHGDILGYEIARNLAHEYAVHGVRLSTRLRELLDASRQVSSERYDRARLLARACRMSFSGAIDQCHVLIAPSATGEAPEGLDSTGNPVMNRVWTLLHVPCITVPVARGPRGLPVGLQVIGRFADDARTLAAAKWIHEQMADPPPATVP